MINSFFSCDLSVCSEHRATQVRLKVSFRCAVWTSIDFNHGAMVHVYIGPYIKVFDRFALPTKKKNLIKYTIETDTLIF